MENEQPKISVITVVFNGAKTLEQTILSVVNQTYANIEYIIIDGGSTDGTLDIIKKYEDKIACWVSEPDEGIYDAMNKGIDAATGEWIYFIGADDWLMGDYIIDEVSKEIDKHNNIDLICGRIMLIDQVLGLKKEYGEFIKNKDILHGNMVPHQGLFTKKNLMKQHLFCTEYRVAADFDFVFKAIQEGSRLAFLDIVIANYSIDGFSSSDEHREKEYKKILTNNGRDFQKSRNIVEIFKRFFVKILIKSRLTKLIIFIKIIKKWERIR